MMNIKNIKYIALFIFLFSKNLYAEDLFFNLGAEAGISVLSFGFHDKYFKKELDPYLTSFFKPILFLGYKFLKNSKVSPLFGVKFAYDFRKRLCNSTSGYKLGNKESFQVDSSALNVGLVMRLELYKDTNFSFMINSELILSYIRTIDENSKSIFKNSPRHILKKTNETEKEMVKLLYPIQPLNFGISSGLGVEFYSLSIFLNITIWTMDNLNNEKNNIHGKLSVGKGEIDFSLACEYNLASWLAKAS